MNQTVLSAWGASLSERQRKTVAIPQIGVTRSRNGASAVDVVRTRMYVTDASKTDEVGRAHGDVFSDIRPATAMIEVKGFIDSRILVEIEADAFVTD